jgi:predicted DNA-binding transcriptional regulator AlpA
MVDMATAFEQNIAPATTPNPLAAWPDDRVCDDKTTGIVTGLSRTARYDLRRQGRFPPAIVLTGTPENPGRIGWRLGDLRAWLAARPRVA